MKYTIVINQKKAIEFGLTLDEVILITCIHDLMPLSTFQKNSNNEVWINHDLFRTEFPLLKLGKTSLYKKMLSLVERGFLTRTVKNAQSKKQVFYGLTEKSDAIFTDSQVHNLNLTSSESELAQVHKMNFTSSESELNHYTSYHNTNNHIYNNSKRENAREILAKYFNREISKVEVEQFEKLITKFEDLEIIEKALIESVKNNVLKLSYVEAILIAWKNKHEQSAVDVDMSNYFEWVR